ncbi:MAG: class I SAM-dependent methyltransferase [Bacteroidetes bacterium]|nr:class I SAM-dependent methyltransferase [Bacteroidota bacterium]
MKPKYDRIGQGYNQTRQADPYLLSRMLYWLSSGSAISKDTQKFLDIGCGTGNYTIALMEKGLAVTGMDPSDRMLETAQKRNPNGRWLKGTAEQIPMPDSSVDGALASLTIHHWSDLRAAFQEIKRVLKPGSPLVIFTSSPRQMNGYWLNHYFPSMLEDSIQQMPAVDIVLDALAFAEFSQIETEKYFVEPDLKDQFLYCGKQDPKKYFYPDIRQGISSFSDLARQAEVEAGLEQLRQDVESGSINTVMAEYENEMGDYLFLRAISPDK